MCATFRVYEFNIEVELLDLCLEAEDVTNPFRLWLLDFKNAASRTHNNCRREMLLLYSVFRMNIQNKAMINIVSILDGGNQAELFLHLTLTKTHFSFSRNDPNNHVLLHLGCYCLARIKFPLR